MSGAAGAAASVVGLGCHDQRGSRRRWKLAASERTLRVWAHQGQEAESSALRAIAASFERAHEAQAQSVELSFFPDHHYIERLSIAGAAGDLPDAFARRSARRESAAVLYLDRARLAATGVHLPSGAAGPRWVDFIAACERLEASGIRAVALHMGESADEWFTYAFSPLIWSGGGRLIDATGARVRGVLASSENVTTLRAWQELFERVREQCSGRPGSVRQRSSCHGLERSLDGARASAPTEGTRVEIRFPLARISVDGTSRRKPGGLASSSTVEPQVRSE